MSDSSSNSDDFSLSCSVSSVQKENEVSELSEVEGHLETIEPYQFEPDASDLPAESEDDDSGEEEGLHNRDW